MKYLYGAAVQGIQEFIFRTNKLKEITGASELVERICTSYFEEVVGKEYDDNNAIVRAAGKVTYVFDDETLCRKVVRNFPKYVLQHVPGVTISQAVIELGEGEVTRQETSDLEKLLRMERNKASRPTTLGLMGIERSRQTGLPSIEIKKGEHIDEASRQKLNIVSETIHSLCKKAFGKDMADKNIAYDTDKMVGDNDWIAIIHADGNGLGQVVQQVSSSQTAIRKFSKDLDNANKNAAQAAFNDICKYYNLKENIPIRPIVLSGDDFTMICRADFALDYTKAFISYFEDETKAMGHSLTACAGIAYVKSSFPFYYGSELAEDLCKAAKQDAKSRAEKQEKAPSCIMMYKVEDSFTESFDEIRNRVLTTNTEDKLSYAFGPYYIHKGQENRWTVEKLQKMVKNINGEDKDSNALKSHIRQWLSIRFNDTSLAEQKIKRMQTTLPSKKNEIEELTQVIDGRVPAYDVLSLHSIQHIVTRENKE